MSDSVLIVTIICGCVTGVMTPLIAALALYLSLRIREIERGVADIHHATNSMKDDLVRATARASFAAGEKSERTNPTSSPGPSLVDPSKLASDRPST